MNAALACPWEEPRRTSHALLLVISTWLIFPPIGQCFISCVPHDCYPPSPWLGLVSFRPNPPYVYFLYCLQSCFLPLKLQVLLEGPFPVFSLASDISQEHPSVISRNGLYRLFFLPCLFPREQHTNFSFCAKLCLCIGCHLITWKVKNSASTLPFLPPPRDWFSCQNASPRLPGTNEDPWIACIHFPHLFPLCLSTPDKHPVLSCRWAEKQ